MNTLTKVNIQQFSGSAIQSKSDENKQIGQAGLNASVEDKVTLELRDANTVNEKTVQDAKLSEDEKKPEAKTNATHKVCISRSSVPTAILMEDSDCESVESVETKTARFQEINESRISLGSQYAQYLQQKSPEQLKPVFWKLGDLSEKKDEPIQKLMFDFACDVKKYLLAEIETIQYQTTNPDNKTDKGNFFLRQLACQIQLSELTSQITPDKLLEAQKAVDNLNEPLLTQSEKFLQAIKNQIDNDTLTSCMQEASSSKLAKLIQEHSAELKEISSTLSIANLPELVDLLKATNVYFNVNQKMMEEQAAISKSL